MTSVDSMEDMSTSIQTHATSTEKDREVAGDQEIIHKIDRLSLLPNELLDHIFDLAYSIDNPSTGALSKHLLPFHITGIYRRISLEKSINVAKLIAAVNRNSTLGSCIEEIKLSCDLPFPRPTSTDPEEEVVRFFSHLTRLVELSIGRAPFVATALLTRAITSPLYFLPALRRLRVPQTYIQETPLVDCTSLNALECLDIVDHDGEDGHFSTSGFSPLLHLWDLTVRGCHGDDHAIVDFCSLCPALTHLTLSSVYPEYGSLLRELPTTLVWLELLLEDGEEEVAMHCDQALSRFQLLENLTLDDYLYSAQLPSYLASLHRLEHLVLGFGNPSLQGIVDLISGTTRLASLSSLDLHLFYTELGTRLDVDEDGGIVGDWELDHGLLVPSDWEIPEFDAIGGSFTLDGVRELLRVAEENEVNVSGSILEALKVMDAYFLEIANIAIYHCYLEGTFNHYLILRDQQAGQRLPPLDLDSLDPNNLKLVKIDLPEEGWFALTLE